MTYRIIVAALAAGATITTPAVASAQAPQPAVTVTTDAAACKAHVNAVLPAYAGVQVNVNNRGTQDDERKLNDNGDAINNKPPVTAKTFDYDFTLPKGEQYSVAVETFNPRLPKPIIVPMDCRNPLEPQIIEKRVEIPVPGPERIVNVPGKTITKRVTKHYKVVCEHKWSRNARKIVIVKGTCHKPPARRAKAKAPGSAVLPQFTG